MTLSIKITIKRTFFRQNRVKVKLMNVYIIYFRKYCKSNFFQQMFDFIYGCPQEQCIYFYSNIYSVYNRMSKISKFLV